MEIISVTASGADATSAPLKLDTANFYELWAIYDDATVGTMQWHRKPPIAAATLPNVTDMSAVIGGTHVATNTENIQTSSGSEVFINVTGLTGTIHIFSIILSRPRGQ